MKSKTIHNSTLKSVGKIALIVTATALLAAGCNQRVNTLQRPSENINTNSNENNDGVTDSGNSGNGEVAGSVTPLPTKKITVAGHELTVEVADTDASREQGLSGRTKLEEGQGMLFDFTNSSLKTPGFWMKNMFMSIDIIWINNDKVLGVEANAPLPPEDSDLPVYYPPSEVTHVLEVPAGWYSRNNISVGSSVQL